jgi:ornithine carrier protein
MEVTQTSGIVDHTEQYVPLMDNEVTSAGKLQEHGLEALKDIVYGSSAGVVGKFIEYPFDTVKVRLQSQPDGLPLRYTGPLDCFKQSLRQDGFAGLYRGISAPLVGAAVETSSLFFSVSCLRARHVYMQKLNGKQYRLAQEALRATLLPKPEPLSLSALIACGAASGAFTSILLTPIELVKCKMQVPVESGLGVARLPSASAIIRSVYRHHGLFGFWHGQLGTLIRETGGSAAWFGSYESMKVFFHQLRHLTPQESLPVQDQMLAGAVAGMSYNFIFYPADTIKSRMQTEDVKEVTSGRRTFWAVGSALWKQHGLRGLYRGCGITVGRAAPSSAFIFTIYEALRKTFG